jgi:hypothetical protein
MGGVKGHQLINELILCDSSWVEARKYATPRQRTMRQWYLEVMILHSAIKGKDGEILGCELMFQANRKTFRKTYD